VTLGRGEKAHLCCHFSVAFLKTSCDNGKVFDAGPGFGRGNGGDLVVREKGVVKWFNAAKGYGFIQRASGEDVFVHFSAIEMSGYRTLEEGAEVEFEVKKGPKGLQAENVGRP
jgi:cold shock protein